MISRIIAAYRQHRVFARPQVAPSPQDEAQQRLAQLVRQTLESPDHIVWKARREAALKGLGKTVA